MCMYKILKKDICIFFHFFFSKMQNKNSRIEDFTKSESYENYLSKLSDACSHNFLCSTFPW